MVKKADKKLFRNAMLFCIKKVAPKSERLAAINFPSPTCRQCRKYPVERANFKSRAIWETPVFIAKNKVFYISLKIARFCFRFRVCQGESINVSLPAGFYAQEARRNPDCRSYSNFVPHLLDQPIPTIFNRSTTRPIRPPSAANRTAFSWAMATRRLSFASHTAPFCRSRK